MTITSRADSSRLRLAAAALRSSSAALRSSAISSSSSSSLSLAAGFEAGSGTASVDALASATLQVRASTWRSS